MAIESTPFAVPLGSALPDVSLPDLDGGLVSLAELKGDRPILVFFGCNHCPYVRHIEDALGELLANYTDELVVAAISSNDVEQYPDDDTAGLRSQTERANWNFPYLIDEDQRAAKAFNAACTPDFFLYDATGALAYRGAFDPSTPKNGQSLTGDSLRTAIENVLAGNPVPEPHQPAMGCGIKWKPGNEPQLVFTP